MSRLSQLSTRPDSVTLTTWAEDAPGRGEGWRQDAKLRRSGQTKATTGPAIDESRCRRNGYRKRETSGVCTGAGWEWAGNRDFGTTPELIHMAECLRARRVRSAAIVSEYGIGLSRFSGEEQSVSHATLVPRIPSAPGRSPAARPKRWPTSASNWMAVRLGRATFPLVQAPEPQSSSHRPPQSIRSAGLSGAGSPRTSSAPYPDASRC